MLNKVTAYLFLALTLSAQVPHLTFDVASVRIDNGEFRPNAGISGGPGARNPGRFTATQVTLAMLLARAFEIESDQFEGPDWLRDLDRHRYTILANVRQNATEAEFRMMLQNLLAERLGLRFHWETRLFPGYELTVVPGGPKGMKKWVPEPLLDETPAVFRSDQDGFPVIAPGRVLSLYGFAPGRTAILKVSVRQSMAGFSKDLGRFINMANAAPSGTPLPRVIDRTGLSDVYEFRLEFEGTANIVNLPANRIQEGEFGGPHLFSALEQQLGLKLVRKGNVPVRVLVIDHAEEVPAEN